MNFAKKRTVILISGRGSNMKSLVEASQSPNFPVEIVLILSNKPEAEGLHWARKKGLPVYELDDTLYKERAHFENELDKALEIVKTDLICLAGFMRLLSKSFVMKWNNRILNIHPSLLPAFKGLHTHQRALEEGVKFTGCTVHLVRPEMDEGPILGQAVVPVLPNDTEEILSARVLAAEHRLYPKVLELFASDSILVEGKKTTFPFTINRGEPIYCPPLA
ncbi:MAG: phosphoribosylglycinamide formyltransferase [Hyphomicrobium sp.]